LKYGSKPYWFGLGFLQLKLSESERMHFWLPEIPHPEREEIHNHRYDFTSQVLAGSLYQETYLVMNINLVDDPKWEIFETDCRPGHEGSVIATFGCDVRPFGAQTLSAGSVYTLPHTTFHTTEGTKFAVTYLTRKPKVLSYASVVKKTGAPTTCPFKEQISEKRCWDYIEHALQRALRELNEMTCSIPCVGCGRPSGSFGPMSPDTIYRCIHCSTD
jgi:hypothetical protein